MPKTKKDAAAPVAKVGRPPTRGVAASERFELRLTPEQLTAYRAAADEHGLPLSSWVAMQLDAAVDRPMPARPEVRKLRAEHEKMGALIDRLDS